MCSSDPPAPDPMIGQAAMANADLSKEMAGVARDQLAWNKARAEKQDPLIQKLAEQQIQTADTNTARAQEQWDQYKNLFQPVEEKMVQDATNWDSDERKARMAAEAGADITRSYQGARANTQREMERMGVNPNSGRFAALNNESLASEAKDSAGAMNKARRDTEQQGIALRSGAAQFGRGMTQTGIAADTAALNAGNAAIGGMQAGAGMTNAGNNAAANWFGGATSANSSAGNLGLGLYGQQINAWGQDQANKAASMQGFGQLIGAGGAAARFRRGGIIGKPRPFRQRKGRYTGGLGRPKKGYAEGGIVEGEGYMPPETVAAGGKPAIRQKHGGVSTEKTITIENDGKHHVIPTIVGGESYEPQAAINMWARGKNPPIATFDSQEKADAFAEQRSRALDRAFGGGGRLLKGPSDPAQGGLRKYAGGGMVDGPGTTTSDSVPAMVNGVQPAALSDGEGVLNAEAVQLVGEDFVHRINAAGLGLSSLPRQPEMEEPS